MPAQHGVRLAERHVFLARAADLVIRRHRQPDRAGRRSPARRLRSGRLVPRFQLRFPRRQDPGRRNLIAAAGGRYVEGAVMTSIPPYRIRCRCCSAAAARRRAGAAARRPRLRRRRSASEKLGVASATKMCRSVMIKGLEAMVIESFTAARAYGVEDAVLASLYETFPGIDWEKQGAYFFQRVIEHGRRRAEEMREVAQTVREAGLDALVRRRHRRAPGLDGGPRRRRALRRPHCEKGFARSADWRSRPDRIIGRESGDPRRTPPLDAFGNEKD
jgi:hypothetical protein